MNFGIVRKDRILQLENKVKRVSNALKTYPYTSPRDYLEDLGALEKFQKELEIQLAYSQSESSLH